MSDQVHAHVAKWKKEELETIVKLLKDSPVIGLANVDAIPSPQMQAMRKTLRDDATIKISKNSLLALALKEAGMGKRGLEGLTENIGGSTAIIATKMKPHRLYRRLEAAKTKAPLKTGQKALEDITVPKGETQVKPGPIVGDLQKAGIPAAIDQGKGVIKQNKVVLKAGEAAGGRDRRPPGRARPGARPGRLRGLPHEDHGALPAVEGLLGPHRRRGQAQRRGHLGQAQGRDRRPRGCRGRSPDGRRARRE